MILSAAGADAMLTGNFSALCNDGYIRVYSGTVPTSATGALGGATLLSGDGRFGATAFGAPATVGDARRITANTMTGDTAADAGGIPSFARIFQTDGNTIMAQCTVSASGGGGELTIDVSPVVQNAPLNFTGFYIELSTV